MGFKPSPSYRHTAHGALCSALLAILSVGSTVEAAVPDVPTRDEPSAENQGGPAVVEVPTDGTDQLSHANLQRVPAAVVDAPTSGADPPPYAYLNPIPDAQTVTSGNPVNQDDQSAALSAFRADLDPFGRWLDEPNYGRVWVPKSEIVGPDFAPYVSAGQWGLDESDNWVWMSDYPFGDVVFHYGRWIFVDGLGWSWIPGLSYAPAWVVWRVPVGDYAYIGWAPAPPNYGWFGGGFARLAYSRPLPFVFCPSRYAFYSHFGGQLVRDRMFSENLVRHTVWQSSPVGFGRSYSSPSLARARVPAAAVPAQRIAASPRTLTLPRGTDSPELNTRTRVGTRPLEGRAPGAMAWNFAQRRFDSRFSASGGQFATTFRGIARRGDPGVTASHLPQRPVVSLGTTSNPRRPAVSLGTTSNPSNAYSRRGIESQAIASHVPSRPVMSLGTIPTSHFVPASGSPTALNHALSRVVSMQTPSVARAIPSRPGAAPPMATPMSVSRAPLSRPTPVVPNRIYSAPSQPMASSRHSFSLPSRSYSSPNRSFSGTSQPVSTPSRGFSFGHGFSAGFRGGGGVGRRR